MLEIERFLELTHLLLSPNTPKSEVTIKNWEQLSKFVVLHPNAFTIFHLFYFIDFITISNFILHHTARLFFYEALISVICRYSDPIFIIKIFNLACSYGQKMHLFMASLLNIYVYVCIFNLCLN